MSSLASIAGNTDFRFIDRPRGKHKLGLPQNSPTQRGQRIAAGPMLIGSHARVPASAGSRRRAARRRTDAGHRRLATTTLRGGRPRGGGRPAGRRPEGREPVTPRERRLREGSALPDRMVGIPRRRADPGGAQRRRPRCRLHRRPLLPHGRRGRGTDQGDRRTKSDPRTQAILVRADSPIRSPADLKGKRLAGTRGGWGQFLISATLEKAGSRHPRPPSRRSTRSTPRSR